nr:uncharacterized protein LOC127316762 [Lolium perenne]XP_051203202.1 uncharacterized protein LOC127316762 [Lolium perenne]
MVVFWENTLYNYLLNPYKAGERKIQARRGLCWALPRRKWNGVGEVTERRRAEKQWTHSLDILVDGSWRRPRIEILPWRWRSCFRHMRRKEQAPQADRHYRHAPRHREDFGQAAAGAGPDRRLPQGHRRLI